MKGKLNCNNCNTDISFDKSDVKKEAFLKKEDILSTIKFEYKPGGFFSEDKFRTITRTFKLLENIDSVSIVCICGKTIWLHHRSQFSNDTIIINYQTKALGTDIGSWKDNLRCSVK